MVKRKKKKKINIDKKWRREAIARQTEGEPNGKRNEERKGGAYGEAFS